MNKKTIIPIPGKLYMLNSKLDFYPGNKVIKGGRMYYLEYNDILLCLETFKIERNITRTTFLHKNSYIQRQLYDSVYELYFKPI